MTSKKPAVLVVDGDIVVRHPLAEYLRECGFRVVEAGSGDDAMRLLTVPDLQIDVVLADLTTVGGGFTLSQRIKAAHMSVDIILAGSIEQVVGKAGDLCNSGPALAKPYEHHLVLDRIKQTSSARKRQTA